MKKMKYGEKNLLREKISAAQHEIWSRWMIHLFKVSIFNTDGSYTIPVEKVKHWKRQISTPYNELSENEKNSDRIQADIILDIIGKSSHNI